MKSCIWLLSRTRAHGRIAWCEHGSALPSCTDALHCASKRFSSPPSMPLCVPLCQKHMCAMSRGAGRKRRKSVTRAARGEWGSAPFQATGMAGMLIGRIGPILCQGSVQALAVPKFSHCFPTFCVCHTTKLCAKTSSARGLPRRCRRIFLEQFPPLASTLRTRRQLGNN